MITKHSCIKLLPLVFYMLFLAGCGSGNGSGPVQNTSNLSEGLVAHWSFDNGDARDDSGNGLDGNLYGVTPTTDRFGNAGKALSFDGSSYVVMPNGSTLNISGEGTVSLWVKENGDTGTLLWKRFYTGSIGWTLYIGFPNTVIGYVNENASLVISSITQGQWQHVVLVYGQNHMKLYVNGILRSSTANTNGFQASDADLYIGKDDSGNYYKGAIDDVRIYNRALTDAEVVGLFNTP